MNKTGMTLDYNIRDIAFVIFFTSAQFSNLFAKLLGNNLGSLLLSLVMLVVYSLAFYEDIKVSKGKGSLYFLLVFILVQVIFLLSYVFNPELTPWLTDSNWGLQIRFYPPVSGFYALLVLLLVRNPKKILQDFKIVVVIRFIHSLLAYRNFLAQGGWLIRRSDGMSQYLSEYNMSFGYSMAFIAVISFAILYLYKEYFYGAIGVISMLLSVLYGSRGVFLVFGSFLVLFFFVLDRNNKIKMLHFVLQGFTLLLIFLILKNKNISIIAMLPLLVSSGLFLGIYLFSSNQSMRKLLLIIQILSLLPVIILMANSIIFGAEGVTTGYRNLDKLLNLSFAEANGRDIIWMNALDGIKTLFPFGNGAYGDRPYIDPTFLWGYSHNIFLEMTLSFGLIGLAFIFYVGFLSAKEIFSKKVNIEYKMLLVIFLSASTKLLISDSFWFSIEFWGWMALLIFRHELRQELKHDNVLRGQSYEK
ncbi:MAG TPA: O-antigen ligase family protein [Candidatus Eisenbacteria bacterium]|nr:O-antigen ligase family protein [Candidatus Eisenbacteria bacterium]